MVNNPNWGEWNRDTLFRGRKKEGVDVCACVGRESTFAIDDGTFFFSSILVEEMEIIIPHIYMNIFTICYNYII